MNNHKNIIEPPSLKMTRALKNGETVICPICGKGEVKHKGNLDAGCYLYCSNCKKTILVCN